MGVSAYVDTTKRLDLESGCGWFGGGFLKSAPKSRITFAFVIVNERELMFDRSDRKCKNIKNQDLYNRFYLFVGVC